MSAELVAALKAALPGELERLYGELKALVEPLDEARFWRRPIEPGNSCGHLVLHLTGNLRHFAGARLGNSGYVRDREREFTEPAPPSKAEALARLEGAIAQFRQIVEGLNAAQFAGPHPDADKMGSVVNALLRLVTHFALHRGQISYLSRLV